jgi:hypothetical protein
MVTLGTVRSQSSGGPIQVERAAGSPLLSPGAYVHIETATGPRLALVERFEGTVKPAGSGDLFLYNCTPISKDGMGDCLGYDVVAPEEADLLAAFRADQPTDVTIGEIAAVARPVPVYMDGQAIFSSHSCFFGGSGSGKSTALKLLVEELLAKCPTVRIVVFDPNSDFSSFITPRDEAAINDSTNQSATLSSADIASRQGLIAAIGSQLTQVPKLYLGRTSPSIVLETFAMELSPPAFLLWSHLWDGIRRTNKAVAPATLHAQLGELDKAHHGEGSLRVFANIGITGAQYVAQARPEVLMAMARLQETPLWSFSTTDSLAGLTASPRFIQFDLGRMSQPDRAVFTEAALRVLWTHKTETADRTPVLIVIDEAHNLVPANVVVSHQRATQNWINMIASEGRKYGLSLLLVSQRPAKIHPNTLDNCQNFFIARLSNRDDIQTLATRAAAISSDMIAHVALLPRHQLLTYGGDLKPAIVRTGRRCVGP